MHTFQPGARVHGFCLDERAHLAEIGSDVLLFTHETLGCRALAIKNADTNKTFCVSFATVPTDSTGVAHILEHSVLMGSRKYPVRDVFGEIHKGGLLTFLNAMTGSDSTYYPFATRNLKEYFNIMDVYCDVVFHPLLAPTTFAQEGWHVHLEAEDGAPTFRGVVFNEMKGALADPMRALVRDVCKGLLPGSTYAHESGGAPRRILDLTYEDFCRFHEKHYHPTNATFFFYGDAPLEEELAFVQDRFLTAWQTRGSSACCAEGTPPDKPVVMQDTYPLAADAEAKDKTFLGTAALTCGPQDREKCLAFELLSNILFNSDASPLKNAIVGAGLGRDFGGFFMGNLGARTVLSSYLIGANPEQAADFFALYKKTLSDLAERGLDHDLILSELNTFEFRLREEMNKPQRGLHLILRAQEAMKQGLSPFATLGLNELLAQVREQTLEARLLEGLIREYLLDNPACLEVTLVPDTSGLETARLEEEARAGAMVAHLDQAGRRRLVEETQALEHLQAQAPSEAELSCLPRLATSELDRRPSLHFAREATLLDRPFLVSELETSGIAYFDLGFDCSAVESRDLPWLGLFGLILTELGTPEKDYTRFATELSLYTGGFDHSFHAVVRADTGKTRPLLWLHMKALSSFLPQAMDLAGQALSGTDFSDRRRIEEIVRREFAWAEQNAQSEGYSLAAQRCFAHLGLPGRYGDAVQGLRAYRALKRLVADYRAGEAAFLAALVRIKNALFRCPGLVCALTAEGPDIERFAELAPAMLSSLSLEAAPPAPLDFPEIPEAEAFTTASEIVYNVQCCRLFNESGGYRGDFEVLKTWLSRDYLWNTVRQQGGAYGCFIQFNPISGAFGLISYRDPQVAGTYRAYTDLPRVIAGLHLSPSALDQLIIGAYGAVNPHQGPAGRGARARDWALAGIGREFLEARLDSILAADVAGLRRYADLFTALAQRPFRVSVGNGDRIRGDAGLFARIEAL